MLQLIDQNSDGLIDEGDLKNMLASLGKAPTSAQLSALLENAQTQNGRKAINFTQFLTMMYVLLFYHLLVFEAGLMAEQGRPSLDL